MLKESVSQPNLLLKVKLSGYIHVHFCGPPFSLNFLDTNPKSFVDWLRTCAQACGIDIVYYVYGLWHIDRAKRIRARVSLATALSTTYVESKRFPMLYTR